MPMANTSTTTDIADIFATRTDTSPNGSEPTQPLSTGLNVSFTTYYTYYYTILLLLTILNITGNSFVIAAVVKFRTLRSNINSHFIGSLACSDILTGLSYCTYQLSHMQGTVVSQIGSKWALCQIIFAMLNAGFMCSSYNLVAITIIRYIAVSEPLKFTARVTKRRAIIITTSIWIMSFVFSFSVNIKEEPAQYAGLCIYEKFQQVGHLVIILFSYTLIPWFLMIILYTRIVLMVRHRLRTNAAKQNQIVPSDHSRQESSVDPHNLKKEMKMTKTVALVLGYFILAWIPLLTYLFVQMSCQSCHIDKYVRGSVRLMLHTNSCCNVFIYAGTNKDFKRALKELVNGLCCRGNATVEPEVSVNTVPSKPGGSI